MSPTCLMFLIRQRRKAHTHDIHRPSRIAVITNEGKQISACKPSFECAKKSAIRCKAPDRLRVHSTSYSGFRRSSRPDFENRKRAGVHEAASNTKCLRGFAFENTCQPSSGSSNHTIQMLARATRHRTYSVDQFKLRYISKN